MIEITQEMAASFYNKFLNKSEEHYNIYRNLQGRYTNYDDMIQRFIKYFGVFDGTKDNVLKLVQGKQKSFLTYDNCNYLFITLTQFISKEKLNEIIKRKSELESMIYNTSFILFTHVTDFLNYMEPNNWIDYFVYTSLFYENKVTSAVPATTLDVGDWIFDQFGNELIVTKILDNGLIQLRETGVRLNNKLFVDYKVISETSKYEDSYIDKPDYNKPINCKNKFIIPAQTTTHCSKILSVKIDKISILVDRDIINGSYSILEI